MSSEIERAAIESIVGLAEGVDEVEVAVYLGKAFVVDNEQSVDIFCHFVGSGDGF